MLMAQAWNLGYLVSNESDLQGEARASSERILFPGGRKSSSFSNTKRRTERRVGSESQEGAQADND